MEEENFLAGIPREGQTLDEVLNSVEKELEVEKPAESLTEKLELPDEDKLGVEKRNNAFEEMREARATAEAKSQALEARLSALEIPESSGKSEFVKSLVGDNEDVERVWAKEKESLKEEWKRELVQEELDTQNKAKEQKEHWAKWTQEQFDKVGITDVNEKNSLSAIMIKYSPTDEQGNLDYGKGKEILNDLGKAKEEVATQKTQVKKNIADATVSKETSVQQNKDFYTSQDLRTLRRY